MSILKYAASSINRLNLKKSIQLFFCLVKINTYQSMYRQGLYNQAQICLEMKFIAKGRLHLPRFASTKRNLNFILAFYRSLVGSTGVELENGG